MSCADGVAGERRRGRPAPSSAGDGPFGVGGGVWRRHRRRVRVRRPRAAALLRDDRLGAAGARRRARPLVQVEADAVGEGELVLRRGRVEVAVAHDEVRGPALRDPPDLRSDAEDVRGVAGQRGQRRVGRQPGGDRLPHVLAEPRRAAEPLRRERELAPRPCAAPRRTRLLACRSRSRSSRTRTGRSVSRSAAVAKSSRRMTGTFSPSAGRRPSRRARPPTITGFSLNSAAKSRAR